MKRICLEDPSMPKNPVLGRIFNRANMVRVSCDAHEYSMNRQAYQQEEMPSFYNTHKRTPVYCNHTMIIKQYNDNGNMEKARMISVQAIDNIHSKRSYPYAYSIDESASSLSLAKKCH